MGHGAPGTAGSVAALSFSADRLEVVAIGTAVALALVLLAVRPCSPPNQRRRKAASAGYHHRDVARYGRDGLGRQEPSQYAKSRPLAPSFTAPGRGSRHSGDPGGSTRPGVARGASAPNSIPSLGTFDPVTNLVRAFDAGEAMRNRPPTAIKSAANQASEPPAGRSPQEVPSIDVEDEIPPPAGALPLLVQPPPAPEEGQSTAN